MMARILDRRANMLSLLLTVVCVLLAFKGISAAKSFKEPSESKVTGLDEPRMVDRMIEKNTMSIIEVGLIPSLCSVLLHFLVFS